MMELNPLLLLGLTAIAISLVTVVLAATLGAGETTGVARSLAIIEQTVDPHEVSHHELPASERLVKPLLDSARKLGYRLSPGGASDRMARLLDLAGNPGSWSADKIMAFKGAGLLGGALIGVVLGGLSVRGILFGLIGATAGFFLPDLLLFNLGIKRQDELRRGLADSLDMMTVCVEAGQSFDAALSQVARAVDGPVAGEFARVLSEIQIGKSRGEAFTSLGARTTVPEVKNFVSALVQADRLGLPIANVLREQSSQMRLVRRQLAEEKAQKVPVKILFPMLLFIFPALFIVIIGPGAIRTIEVFSGGGF
jgi:tight adherence protein C